MGYFDLDIVGWDVFGPWDISEGQDRERGPTAGMCPGTHFDVVIPCAGESLVREEAEGGYGHNSRQSGPELNWGSCWGPFAQVLGCGEPVKGPITTPKTLSCLGCRSFVPALRS